MLAQLKAICTTLSGLAQLKAIFITLACRPSRDGFTCTRHEGTSRVRQGYAQLLSAHTACLFGSITASLACSYATSLKSSSLPHHTSNMQDLTP